MSRPAILVENVTVRFRPYIDKKPTLRRSIANLRTRAVEEVVALDDVSFRVEKGEAFGIIGRNGAGKSTLLRVMARTLRPNSGRVVVNGRASTLLQLGVGMNPELSGTRNIYLGGLAAGLRRAEVDAIFDDIVEYAGLGDAIHRPVKTYSSGMFSRLAFSVSMHLNPDILLLDEVLAVGDAEFRDKSMKTMRELLDRAGTIVFVSHSLSQVADFCDRAMWLEKGHVRQIGDAEAVVAAYIEDQKAQSAGANRDPVEQTGT
jgi:ABC-type polysaccharide/polyol phosphate transport system ATPase subunit